MKRPNPILAEYGTTVFEVMSRLAREHDAINLGQGFPDGNGPEDVRRVAADALEDMPNQYPPMFGVEDLRKSVAEHNRRFYGLDVDWSTEVGVTSGATEALAALDYLVERRREVPKQLSVVGFDDSPEALSRRLTSYNFDCAGTVHVALHYALGSYAQARGKTAHWEDIEGYLVERQTTASAGPSSPSPRTDPGLR